MLSYLAHETDLFADEEVRVVVTSERAGLEREGDLFALPLGEVLAILDAGGEDAEQRLVEALMGW